MERALAGEVRTLFQPLVCLESRATLGYEALTRGPAGTSLERPASLFAAARAAGRVPDLDIVCQATAISAAMEAGLPTPLTLFVNAEPEGARNRIPDQYTGVIDDATAGGMRLIVEWTERALLDDPAGLMLAAEQVRRYGWGMALDDVGLDPRALALLPIVEPDVIKLDVSLMHAEPTPRLAEVAHAIAAEAERRGTLILAEGIETEEQLQRALALGATVGQGFLFGPPGELRPPRADPGRRIPIAGPRRPGPPPTPFDVLSATRSTRPAMRPLVLALTRHLEDQAAALAESAVLLSSFQHGGHLGPEVRRRYAELAERLGLVAALGSDSGPAPAPGVRGRGVTHFDPLGQQWAVALISPHFAGALAARDLGDPGPDERRRFDLGVTYDRNLVVECARSLLSHVAPRAAMPAPEAAAA